MTIVQCIHDITTTYGLILSLFLAGLVGGFTHCTGMCGPLVLAQTKVAGTSQKTSFLLLPYHLGRMTTYVALAVLVSGFINLAFVFSDLKILISAPLLMLAGVVFLVSAFPALRALFPWAAHLRIGLPVRWIQRLQNVLPYKNERPNPLKRYMLGILLGFMPCGLVVSALLASASATSTIQAAAAMIAFAAGTMPALILTALGGQALQSRYPGAATRLSQGAMLVSGLWLFALAGSMFL